jgi:hypothetical protein
LFCLKSFCEIPTKQYVVTGTLGCFENTICLNLVSKELVKNVSNDICMAIKNDI